MILVSDRLLFDIVYILKDSSQSESSITPDQSNPSKLEPFKSYSKTIIIICILILFYMGGIAGRIFGSLIRWFEEEMHCQASQG